MINNNNLKKQKIYFKIKINEKKKTDKDNLNSPVLTINVLIELILFHLAMIIKNKYKTNSAWIDEFKIKSKFRILKLIELFFF